MKKLDIIIEQYPDEELLKADGFDDAVIGVAYDMKSSVYRIVYSIGKCIDVLITRDGMSYEEAEEYFSFNVSGAYMGEKTPIWMEDQMFEMYEQEDTEGKEIGEGYRTFDDIE